MHIVKHFNWSCVATVVKLCQLFSENSAFSCNFCKACIHYSVYCKCKCIAKEYPVLSWSFPRRVYALSKHVTSHYRSGNTRAGVWWSLATGGPRIFTLAHSIALLEEVTPVEKSLHPIYCDRFQSTVYLLCKWERRSSFLALSLELKRRF